MRITGQQIHEAYLHTIGGNGQAWESMSEGLKARYGCMAERLNPSWEHTVVCLCGSTRFMQAFQDANLRETLAGNIVLSIGCDTKNDSMLHLAPEVKEQLDLLHLRKIDLADEVLVLNVDCYIGGSTAREILYAMEQRKPIRWLIEPDEDKLLLDMGKAVHSADPEMSNDEAMGIARHTYRQW